MAYLSSLIS